MPLECECFVVVEESDVGTPSRRRGPRRDGARLVNGR